MRRFIALCTLAAAASFVSYAGDADAAPLKCVSNDINAGPAVVSDVVTTDAPIQKGHLHVAGAAGASSTCAAPTAAPAVLEPAATFNYKAHTFKNRSNAAACVEVRYAFTASAQGTGFHETTAYLGGFDSTNPAANYLADSGRNDAGPDARVFSFNVPAMNDFTLVTTWAGPATPGYEPKYDLYVANCGQLVVTGVTPNAGPVEGGQAVTIAGSGFEGTAAAVYMPVPATNVVVVDDNTLTAMTAPNPAGTYDVSVSVNAGAAVATLAAGYTYGAATTDAGTDAGLLDGGVEGGLDAGRDASTGGPTQGGPTQGSSSSGGTTNTDSGIAADGGDDDDDDASTGDGGAKKASGTIKKKTGGDEELVCACNEVGKGTTPGLGAFATMALGILAVLRIRKRR